VSTDHLEAFYRPTFFLEIEIDILVLRAAARMVMMGMELTDQLPIKT
jgi:valyl-tRNA synthetase